MSTVARASRVSRTSQRAATKERRGFDPASPLPTTFGVGATHSHSSLPHHGNPIRRLPTPSLAPTLRRCDTISRPSRTVNTPKYAGFRRLSDADTPNNPSAGAFWLAISRRFHGCSCRTGHPAPVHRTVVAGDAREGERHRLIPAPQRHLGSSNPRSETVAGGPFQQATRPGTIRKTRTALARHGCSGPAPQLYSRPPQGIRGEPWAVPPTPRVEDGVQYGATPLATLSAMQDWGSPSSFRFWQPRRTDPLQSVGVHQPGLRIQHQDPQR